MLLADTSPRCDCLWTTYLPPLDFFDNEAGFHPDAVLFNHLRQSNPNHSCFSLGLGRRAKGKVGPPLGCSQCICGRGPPTISCLVLRSTLGSGPAPLMTVDSVVTIARDVGVKAFVSVWGWVTGSLPAGGCAGSPGALRQCGCRRCNAQRYNSSNKCGLRVVDHGHSQRSEAMPFTSK